MKDFDKELALRKDAQTSPAAAQVLADFYEECGQPTRAKMWRRPISNGSKGTTPDLVAKRSPWSKVDPRRDALVWLLRNVLKTAELAKLFGISSTRVTRIADKEQESVCFGSYVERRDPNRPFLISPLTGQPFGHASEPPMVSAPRSAALPSSRT